MITCTPKDEQERLQALQSYDVWHTPPERAFDDLAELAARICDAPIALITLVGETQQWFKAKVGVSLAETSRDTSFCAHAICQPGMFVVPDATKDERFAHNPLVTTDPNIRFYAGSPLITPEGHALGTLCVLDRKPRELSPENQQALRVLSRHVMTQLELRRRSRELRESQRARERAEASKLEVSHILERIDDAFLALDNNGCCTYANEKAAELLQLPMNQLVGKNLYSDLHAGIGQPLFEACARAMTEQQIVRFDLYDSLAWRWHETRVYPSPGGVTVFMSDITERVRSEAELTSQAAKLREQSHLLERAHVLACDMQGRIIFWNLGAAEIYGWLAHEALGRTPCELLRTEYPEPLREIFETIKSTGTWRGELVNTCKSGSKVTVASRWTLHRDLHGDPKAVLQVNNDITELKRTQGRLETQAEALRALSARLRAVREQESTRISREIHDVLGQLLTGAKLEVRSLQNRISMVTSESQQSALMEKCGAVSSLLDSSLEAVQKIARELRPVILDTFGLVAALESEARQFQERTGITCEWHGPLQKINPGREASYTVFRIFQEILTNAARHSGAEKVGMNLEVRAGELLLEVADNGRGITADQINDPGALGLLGMRERAANVGGRLQIEGNPGKGTRVSVCIPFNSEAEAR